MHDELLMGAYDAYNRKDLTCLTSLIADDVDWPGDDGHRLRGRAAVVEYWTAQWTRTSTTDSVGVIARLSEHVRAVRIDQVVRSTGGRQISSGTFVHVVHTDADRIRRLDIVPVTLPPRLMA